MGQDASTRSYARVEKSGRAAILMDCSLDERPDHGLDDYIRIAGWLNDIGLRAPEIYEREKNYLIIEDFGNISFKKAMEQNGPAEIYALAADVLAHLREQKNLPSMPPYYDSNVHKTHRRVIDWYVPTVKRKKILMAWPGNIWPFGRKSKKTRPQARIISSTPITMSKT